MNETALPPSHDGSVVLSLGGDIGAIVLHTPSALLGAEIELSPAARPSVRTHTAVRERRLGQRSVFAAVFPSVPAGDHVVWDLESRPAAVVTVIGGAVTEVQWPSIEGKEHR